MSYSINLMIKNDIKINKIAINKGITKLLKLANDSNLLKKFSK